MTSSNAYSRKTSPMTFRSLFAGLSALMAALIVRHAVAMRIKQIGTGWAIRSQW